MEEDDNENEDKTFERWWNQEGADEEASRGPQTMEKGEDDELEEGRQPKRIIGPG